MKSTAGIMQVLGLSLLALFATTAVARQTAETEKAAQPRADAAASPQWRTVRLANGVEGKLAEMPERLRHPLVAERGPDGRYQVRHADGQAAPTPESGP